MCTHEGVIDSHGSCGTKLLYARMKVLLHGLRPCCPCNVIFASIQNITLHIQTGSQNAIFKCHRYCTRDGRSASPETQRDTGSSLTAWPTACVSVHCSSTHTTTTTELSSLPVCIYYMCIIWTQTLDTHSSRTLSNSHTLALWAASLGILRVNATYGANTEVMI